MSHKFLFFLFIVGMIGGKVESSCNVVSQCRTIVVQASTKHMNVSGLAAGFVLQNITAINGTAVRASDGSYNNTTLMSFVSGTLYTVHYGNSSIGCCYNVTTKPMPVTSLQIAANSSNSLSLTWTKPAEFQASYIYVVKTFVTSPSSLINTTIVTNEAIIIMKLTAGETFTFLVYTRAADNVTDSDPVSLTTCTVPRQALNVTANSYKSVNSLVVSWKAPAGKVSNYNVAVTGNANQTKSTTSTQLTFTGLSPGRDYTVTVETVSGICSQASPPVTEATYPTPPSSMSISTTGINNSVLSWGEPVNMSGVAKSYIITYWNISSSFNWTQTSNTTNVTLQYLASGTNYTISVVTAGVRHYPSAPVSRWVYTKPFPVKNLQSLMTLNTMCLQWTKPDGYKNSYKYKVWTNTSSPSSSNTTVTTETLLVMNLSPGGTYTSLVYTIAGVTESDPVSVTNCTVPGQAVGVTVNSYKSVNSLVVNWTAPTGKVSYYNVTMTGNVRKQTNTTQLTFTGLSPGREYTVTVQTVSGSCSSAITTVTEATYPSPPGNITFNTIRTNITALSWGDPVNMTVVIKWYNITYRNSSSTNWSIISSMPNVIVQSLASGVNYTFSVVTVGPHQHLSAPVTRWVYTKPPPVKWPQATNVTSSSVLLTWTRPDGYTSVRSYRVQTNVTSSSTLIYNTIVTNESATIVSLTPGETYTFLLYTRAADNVTESDPVSLTTCTDPNPPAYLIVNKIGTNSITLSWGQPENMINVTKSYQISWNSNRTVISNTSITLQNLTSRTNYSITVVTIGVRGCQSEGVRRSVYTSPLEQSDSVQAVRSSSGNAMDVTFQGFDTSNGPIVAYAIIMTTDLTANKPPDGVLAKTYNDFKTGSTKTYVTSLIENTAAARSNVISAHVGNGTQRHGYLNGPLDPKLQYRISVAGFTSINYDAATDTINEDRSTATITGYTGAPATASTRINYASLRLVTVLLGACHFLIRL